MTQIAVIEAVEARLRAGFTAAPIKGLNDGDPTPADGSAFVELQFPVSNTRQMVLGRKYQEAGAFRIVISVERGLREHFDKALRWAGEISDLYRTKTFDGVKSWTPNTNRLDDENDDGNYYVLSVIVPYDYSFTG